MGPNGAGPALGCGLYDELLARQLGYLLTGGDPPKSEALLNWFGRRLRTTEAGSSATRSTIQVDLDKCSKPPEGVGKVDCSSLADDSSVVSLDFAPLVGCVHARVLDLEFEDKKQDCAILDEHRDWITPAAAPLLLEKVVGRVCAEHVVQLLCERSKTNRTPSADAERTACEQTTGEKLGIRGGARRPVEPRVRDCATYESEASTSAKLGFRLNWDPPLYRADESWETTGTIRELAVGLDRQPIAAGGHGRIFVVTGKAGIGKTPAGHTLLAHLCRHYPVKRLSGENRGAITPESINPPAPAPASPRIVVLDDFDKLKAEEAIDVSRAVRAQSQVVPTTYVIFTREIEEDWFGEFNNFAWHAELQPYSEDEGLALLLEALNKPNKARKRLADSTAWTSDEVSRALDEIQLLPASTSPGAPIGSFYDADGYAAVLDTCWDRMAKKPSCPWYQRVVKLDKLTHSRQHDEAVHRAWRVAPTRPWGFWFLVAVAEKLVPPEKGGAMN